MAKEHISVAVEQVFGEGLQVGHHIEDLAGTGASSGSGSQNGNGSHAATGAVASWARGASALDPAGMLLAEARKQFSLSRGLAMESRKRRLVGWLQRRGHR